ncbi:hypothetical protein [Noviherbaspirillum sedimenti]|uniref:DUF3999 family protein n=1 Tax=Noviherbaspirillum sedimenti TaxID=2320865 RepID=A0A3A3G4I0_9BURK|nr:hypothetical protein [Noviherbaspirillum sedimenti]RJG03403.1 hypothetical protein D3878_18870 [Noviherbaspirillum sedimenti]
MRPFFLLPRALLRLSLLLLLLPALPAQAGNISFNLSITGDRLTLSNQGDSPAFAPRVLRLLDGGHWETLQPPAGEQAPRELKPQAQYQLTWPERAPPANTASPETLRPVMVRFFDQAGAGFGQISFFNQPQPASDDLTLDAGYVDGRLRIGSPKNPAIKATWLLWAQEEGIAALSGPVTATRPQPDALRIEWGPGSGAQNLDLGQGMPVAFLLHETAQGLRSQVVPTGRVQGRQQRTAWLNLAAQFRSAALVALLAGLALLAWHLGTRRKHSISTNP